MNKYIDLMNKSAYAPLYQVFKNNPDGKFTLKELSEMVDSFNMHKLMAMTAMNIVLIEKINTEYVWQLNPNSDGINNQKDICYW